MSKKDLAKSDMPNFRKKYVDMVIPAMMKQFNYKNVMEVPKITHISINMGIGDAKDNPKKLESALSELTLISAQKPVVTRSRKDISNFKIRKGYTLYNLKSISPWGFCPVIQGKKSRRAMGRSKHGTQHERGVRHGRRGHIRPSTVLFK